jgi:hypothetical protein
LAVHHSGRSRSEGQRDVVSVRDVLVDELRRESEVASKMCTSLNVDWGRLLRKAASEAGFHPKRVVELQLLKDVMRILLHRQFDDVRRTELRRHPAKKSWHTLYTIVFRDGDVVSGYAAMINVPETYRGLVEKSSGTVHAAHVTFASNGEEIVEFEDARFNDYSAEVKPHIEILGNLYRRTRRL